MIPSSFRPAFRLFVAFALLSQTGQAQDTWDNRTSQITGGVNTNAGITYNGSRFILVTATSTFWKSVAGTSNWTFGNLGLGSVTGLSIDHGAGVTLVAASNNSLARTTVADPVNSSWEVQRPVTGRPFNDSTDLYRVRYLNGRFLIGTESYFDNTTPANGYSEVLSSLDGGVSWTSHKFAYASVGNQTFDLRDVAFKPGAVPGAGTYVFATRTNAVLVAPESLASASRVTFSTNSADSATTLLHAANLFLVLTSNGKIFTSPTGATGSWTQRSTPVATSFWSDVFHDGSQFVLVGATVSGSSPQRPAILASADGVTWTEATQVPATSASLATVYKADGLWLAGGSSRTLLTSGSASVSAPSFSVQPGAVNGSVGGTLTLTATVTGTPAPTLQWYRLDASPTALVDDARISGATSGTLTITGATFNDARNYYLAATNSVGTTVSNTAVVTLNASGGGALFQPYFITNSLGGELIPGSAPAASLIGGSTLRYTLGTGATALPNTFINGVAYGYLGGLSPDGTWAVLNALSSSVSPPLVHNLTTGVSAQMPVPALPLGPVASYTFFNASAIADTGDIIGQLQTPEGINHGFVYRAASQTYSLLGTVPNATNDIATNPAAISADGASVVGYERIGLFNGAFLWTSSGFTLLPQPANGGLPNADIRDISPLGRFIVGFGGVGAAFGSGSTAHRWDRGAGLANPVGLALPRRPTDSFADALTVTDDGTAGGTVRFGSLLTGNRAAVWMPNGVLILLQDYLTANYGLNFAGLTLTHVTSVSADRRRFAGTALRSDSTTDGWILTLPSPLQDARTGPEIAVQQFNTERANGTSVFIGSRVVGSPGTASQTFYVRNDGPAPLSGLSASLGGADALDFALVYDGSQTAMVPTLSFNHFERIRITFAPRPGSLGTRTATLTLTNNDADESPFTLTLNGTALAPASLVAFEASMVAQNVPVDLRGPSQDADGDGLSNLMEFALGLQAMSPDAQAAPSVSNDAGILKLTYKRAQPVHVTYSVKTTDLLSNPAGWTATGVDQGAPDANGMTTASIPLGTDPSRFLRLEVALTP